MVAGGDGRRFGGAKQFALLGGRPLAAWSTEAARPVSDGIVLVVPADRAGAAAGPTGEASTEGALGVAHRSVVGDAAGCDADRIVVGGETRAASVRAGLSAVPDDAAIIVVHDAARPLASTELFESVVGGVRSGLAQGVVPVIPVTDTLKRVEGLSVRSTIDRAGLVAVQTPQAFVGQALRASHRHAGEATDDAGLLERRGSSVATVEGEPGNVKITLPHDLWMAEALLAAGPKGVRAPDEVDLDHSGRGDQS